MQYLTSESFYYYLIPYGVKRDRLLRAPPRLPLRPSALKLKIYQIQNATLNNVFSSFN